MFKLLVTSNYSIAIILLSMLDIDVCNKQKNKIMKRMPRKDSLTSEMGPDDNNVILK